MSPPIRIPENIPALLDVALIFGGLALFLVALRLVRKSEAGPLIVFGSQLGFLAGGLWGDSQVPASVAWEHLHWVATGVMAGTAVGVGVGVVVALLLAAWRARGRSRAKREGALKPLVERVQADRERALQERTRVLDPPTLGIDRVQIQRFLKGHRN